MKKLFLLSLLVLMSASAAMAGRVSPQAAADYAAKFMHTRTNSTPTLSSTELFGDVYIVNLSPQGWVIISADDAAAPVIGYNTRGYVDRFNMPDNMKGMLEVFSDEIRAIGSQIGQRHTAWSNAASMSRAEGSPVAPLISVHWNQQEPYWKYCPKTGGDALVGCVAVATSQAMSVQRYPDRPQGSKTYTCANYGRLSIDFDAEKPYDWDAILSGANNYDEAARLMFHAGMAVEMMYGTTGSGVYTSRLYIIKDALVNHFKYKDEEVQYMNRDQYRGDWEQLMLGELQAGRAIVYNGVDTRQSGGHSFNVDGFDGKGLFHVNWGWGGASEGYFNLNVLNGGSYTFSDQQCAVFGIGSPNKTLRSISLTDREIESGIEAGSTASAVLVNGEIPSADFTVGIHGSKTSSGSYREIPFTYDNGMIKTTRELKAGENSFLVEVDVVHNPSGESMTQGFTISVAPHRNLDEATSVSYDRAKQTFTVHSKHNTRCTVTSASGTKVVDNQQMQPLPQIQISRSLLTKGRNTVSLTCGSETKTFVITIP